MGRLPTDRGGLAKRAITIADESIKRVKRPDDFIRRLVFPVLPAIYRRHRRRGVGISDLRIVDPEDLGLHYTETLRRWRTNLERQRPDVHRLGFDEKFGRFPFLFIPALRPPSQSATSPTCRWS